MRYSGIGSLVRIRSLAGAAIAAGLFSSILFVSGSARADAIDGDWCYLGRHLSINGPDITTPGGTRRKGEYDRHHFAYVVPAGEAGAGEPVRMAVQDDENMILQQGSAKPQPWTRCRAPTS